MNLDINSVTPRAQITKDGIQRGAASVGRRKAQQMTLDHDRVGMTGGKTMNILEDEAFLRRLKKQNYGKWYLKPEQYVNKVSLLNSELKKLDDMKN